MSWDRERQAEFDPFWKNVTVTGHFYRRERKRMVLCSLGLTALLGYLVFVAKQSPLLFLVPPLVLLLAVGRMLLGGTRAFSREMASLDPFRRSVCSVLFSSPIPNAGCGAEKGICWKTAFFAGSAAGCG